MLSENVHLLVLIHGMWGNPVHLAEMHRIMREAHSQPDSETGPAGEKLEILAAETNSEAHTYDGVDWGGERVADEVSCFSEIAECMPDLRQWDSNEHYWHRQSLLAWRSCEIGRRKRRSGNIQCPSTVGLRGLIHTA